MDSTTPVGPAVATPDEGEAPTHTRMDIDQPAPGSAETPGGRLRTSATDQGTPNPSEAKKPRVKSPVKGSKAKAPQEGDPKPAATPAASTPGSSPPGSARKALRFADQSAQQKQPSKEPGQEPDPEPVTQAQGSSQAQTHHEFAYNRQATPIWSTRFHNQAKHAGIEGFDPMETDSGRTLEARSAKATDIIVHLIQHAFPGMTKETLTIKACKAVFHDSLRQEQDLAWKCNADKDFITKHGLKLAKTTPDIFGANLTPHSRYPNKGVLKLTSETKQWLAISYLYGNIWKYFNKKEGDPGTLPPKQQLKKAPAPATGAAGAATAGAPQSHSKSSSAAGVSTLKSPGPGGWITVLRKPGRAQAQLKEDTSRHVTVWQIRKPIIPNKFTLGQNSIDRSISNMAKHHVATFHRCDPTVTLLPMKDDPASVRNLTGLAKKDISTLPPTLTTKNASDYYQFFQWTTAQAYQNASYFQTRIRTETSVTPEAILSRFDQYNEEVPEDYRLLALRICPVQSIPIEPICWLLGSATDSMNVVETEMAVREGLTSQGFSAVTIYLENRPIQTTTIKQPWGSAPKPRIVHATHVMGNPQERDAILDAFTALYTAGRDFNDYPMCKPLQMIPCIQSPTVDPQQQGYTAHQEAMARQQAFQDGQAYMSTDHFRQLQGYRVQGDGHNLLEALMSMVRRGSQGKIRFLTAVDTMVTDPTKIMLTFPAEHEPEMKTVMNAGPLTLISAYGPEAEQWCTELALAKMDMEYTKTPSGGFVSKMASRFDLINLDFAETHLTPRAEKRAETIREQMAADREAAGEEDGPKPGCEITNMEFMHASKASKDPTSGVIDNDNPSIAAQEASVFSDGRSQGLDSSTVAGSVNSCMLDDATVKSSASRALDEDTVTSEAGGLDGASVTSDSSKAKPPSKPKDSDKNEINISSSSSDDSDTVLSSDARDHTVCPIFECGRPGMDTKCIWCCIRIHRQCAIAHLLGNPYNSNDLYCSPACFDEDMQLRDQGLKKELLKKSPTPTRANSMACYLVPQGILQFATATEEGDRTWWDITPKGRKRLYKEYLKTVAAPHKQPIPYFTVHAYRIFSLALQVHVRKDLLSPETFVAKVTGTLLTDMFAMHECYHDEPAMDTDDSNAPPPDNDQNHGGLGENP